ncbi:MAG: hypothetical protein V4647_01805 [Pseudomonadota bacterium]
MTRSTPPPPRIPPFHPVPTRARADGWTPLRQAEFIGMLAQTGSVAAAAAFVGMARETAYRLRGKPGADSFNAAWDAALIVAGVPRAPSGALAHGTHGPPKVTPAEPWRVILCGRWRVVMRRGKYCGSVRQEDNSALLGWLAQLDRAGREGRAELRRKGRAAQQSHPAKTANNVPPRGGSEGPQA